MPFRRNRRSRRSRPRRRRRRFRGRRRMMSRRAPVEQKFIDFTAGAALASDLANRVLIPLNAMPQGITENDRIGLMSTARSILIRLSLNVTGGPPQQNARVMIVLEKEPAGAQIDTANILANNSPATDPLIPILSPRKLDRAGRYRVLFDRRVVFTNATNQRALKIFRKLNFTSRHSNMGGGFADIQTNSLWLIMFSDQPFGGAPPSYVVSKRFRFVG